MFQEERLSQNHSNAVPKPWLLPQNENDTAFVIDLEKDLGRVSVDFGRQLAGRTTTRTLSMTNSGVKHRSFKIDEISTDEGFVIANETETQNKTIAVPYGKAVKVFVKWTPITYKTKQERVRGKLVLYVDGTFLHQISLFGTALSSSPKPLIQPLQTEVIDNRRNLNFIPFDLETKTQEKPRRRESFMVPSDKNAMAMAIEFVLNENSFSEQGILNSLSAFKTTFHPGPITNIVQSMKNGVILCSLVSKFSGQSLNNVESTPVTNEECLKNIEIAFKRLKSLGLVFPPSIKPEGIVTGDRKVVFELLWLLFSHFIISPVCSSTALQHEIFNLRWQYKKTFRERFIPSHTNIGNCQEPLSTWLELVSSLSQTPVLNFGNSKLHLIAFAGVLCKYGASLLSQSHMNALSEKSDARALTYSINQVIRQIGDIPVMLTAPIENFISNRHYEERVFAIFTALLVSRLMGLRKIEKACVKIQRFWRIQVTAKREERRREEAFVKISRFLLGTAFRKRFESFHEHLSTSLLSIQSSLQSVNESYIVRIQVRGFILLQQKMRSIRQRRDLAALTIQRTWTLFKQNRAAYEIQKLYRAKSFGLFHEKLFSSIKVLQFSLLAWQEAQSARIRLNQVKMCKTIQSALHSTMERSRFLSMKASALTVQYRRRKVTRKRVFLDRLSLLQGALQFFKNRKQFILLKECSRTIRASFKSIRYSKTLFTITDSTWSLSSAMMSFKLSSEFQNNKRSAEICQVSLDSFAASKAFDELRNHCISLQTALSSLQQSYAMMRLKRTASVIQSAFRGRNELQEVKDKTRSIHLIQSFVSVSLSRSRFTTASERFSAAVLLQSYWKRFQTQSFFSKAKQAVFVLQGAFRFHRSNQMWKSSIQSIIRCQCIIRRFIAWKSSQRKKESIALVQSTWRISKSRQYFLELKKSYAISSCMKIQGSFKTFLTVLERLKTLSCITLLQRAYRKRFALRTIASTKIQSAARAFRARLHYLPVIRAVKVLQTCMKTFSYTRAVFVTCFASKSIQGAIRSRHLFRGLEWIRSAAQVAQSGMKTHAHHCFISALVQSSDCVSAFLKCYTEQRRRLQELKAATVISALAKGFITCKKYIATVNAIFVLSGSFLSVNRRRSFNERKTHCLSIECAFSTLVQHNRVFQLYTAATTLQSYIRTRSAVFEFNASKDLRKVLKSVVLIENAWTRFKQSIAYRKRVYSRIKLQRWIRSIRHRTKFVSFRNNVRIIQSSLHIFALRFNKSKDAMRVVKVQALARGWITRKNSSSAVKEAYRKLEIANSNWTREQSIAYRTQVALQHLVDGKHLTEMAQALKELALLTSLLPWCCAVAVQVGAVPILYEMLNSLNRSEPHQEIARSALSMLNHLAAHPDIGFEVFEFNGCFPLLVNILVHFQRQHILVLKAAKLLKQGIELKATGAKDLKNGQDVKRIKAVYTAIQKVSEKNTSKKRAEAYFLRRCVEILEILCDLVSRL